MADCDKQTEIFRAMSPERKLELSMSLYYSARRLKKAWLEHLHPDWTPELVEAAVREAFASARS